MKSYRNFFLTAAFPALSPMPLSSSTCMRLLQPQLTICLLPYQVMFDNRQEEIAFFISDGTVL